ncbi:MAG: hypothetical protein N2314_09295 [Brevinematales bacterium]|nr:hypothetical protein [Brevinematales bacterium]
MQRIKCLGLWVLVVVGCTPRVIYEGKLLTPEYDYQARLVVDSAKEEASLDLKIKAMGSRDTALQGNVIDLIAPSGAQSIPTQKTWLSRFLLSQGQTARARAKWRLINDPAFYQLYGMAGDTLPSNYTLNVGVVVGTEPVLLTVQASEKSLSTYQKQLNPILAHYKVVFPQDFEKIQKAHLVTQGWIVQDSHDDHEAPGERKDHESDDSFSSPFLVIGEYTVLMDGRYYVGFYGFSRKDRFVLRVILVNREAEMLSFVPEKLLLQADKKTLKPRVKKSLFQKKVNKAFVLSRNERGEWLLEYPLSSPPEQLFLHVKKAFVSPQGKELFAVENLGLQASQ